MPLERLPDLPRVVVARIEGRDTLYEFDLTAAPSRECRAAFLPATSCLTTADYTRIDQWIAYANSIVEE